MEKDKIDKRVYVRECTGSRSVSSPRKRWTDTMKDCLRKRGLDISQARRIVQDRSECMGRSPGYEPLTLMRCHNYMKPFMGESPFVAKPST